MGRRLIATVASLAIGFVGALIFAAPASAATPATSVSVTFDWCEFPEDVKDAPQVPQAESAKFVSRIFPGVLDCLEKVIVHKCDNSTVITLVNWAKIDAIWTRITVEINGQDYVVKGGPDHTPVVVTLGPPGVEDEQLKLVFEGSTGDTQWRIEKNYGDPITWELPEACPTASPSPSVTVSPSPSVSVSTPATTTAPPAVAPRGNDLPVTGASATLPVAAGLVLLVAAAAYWGFMIRRRRKAEAGL